MRQYIFKKGPVGAGDLFRKGGQIRLYWYVPGGKLHAGFPGNDCFCFRIIQKVGMPQAYASEPALHDQRILPQTGIVPGDMPPHTYIYRRDLPEQIDQFP